MALLSAYAQGEKKTKVKGLFTARTDDTFVLKTTDGSTMTVTLGDDTKVQQPEGLGIRKKQMSAAVLIPGLKVSVDGTSQDATHVLAKSITFDADDLQTAEMIQAGLNPTEQKVAANRQNIAKNKQNIEANRDLLSDERLRVPPRKAEAARVLNEQQQEQVDGFLCYCLSWHLCMVTSLVDGSPDSLIFMA